MIVGERHLRQGTAILGALFFSGALWVTLAWLVGWWPQPRSGAMVVAGVALAYIVGVAGLVGSRRTTMPLRWMELCSALGSITVAVVVVGGGVAASGAMGGFYGYVAAFAFFYDAPRRAVAQLAFCGLCYAVALAVLDVPGAAAQWIVVIGIAGGGAGLVGLLGQRTRDVMVAEQAAADRLRDLDRMKNAFLQAVSHELRTPVAAMLGYADVIHRHRDQLTADEFDQMTVRLSANGHRLERLLTDLLDVDRLSAGDMEPRREPTALDELVRRAAGEVSLEGRTLVLDLAPVTLAVESGKIERVAENLIGNAVKHTPSGTTIRVRLGPGPDGGAELTVEDDGAGIPEDIRERMLEPFVQGRASDRMASPGTGIGLALVDGFVTMHGGKLEIEDVATGGTRVTVRLSRVDADAEDRSAQDGGAVPAALGWLRRR